MKIAALVIGDPKDQKGGFNATHQRIKHLICEGIEVDVFIIRYYESRLIQVLRKKPYQKQIKTDYFLYDDIKYNNLWIPLTLHDYFQWQKLNQLGSILIRFAKKWSKLFIDYKLISAHSLEPAIIATLVKEQFGIPFTVTWHGSDIHSMPKRNISVKKEVIKICYRASAVFFVSKELQIEAKNLGVDITNSVVLYNAVDRTKFKPYSTAQRENLKNINQIDGVYNIGFIGNLLAIKNSQLLPEIFKIITDNVKNVKFYFVGDGKLKPVIAKECQLLYLNAVFMGNRLQEDMPDIINCFDVVVLPSRNEGLPLIVLECLSCQIPIITSKVGGIPEVLNEEYTIVHGPEFTKRFADAVINLLNDPNKKNLELPQLFDWRVTAKKEITIYHKILNTN